jgi:hypothetical protein
LKLCNGQRVAVLVCCFSCLFREVSDIEKSFPMSKSDLQAQRVYQRERDSIGDRLMIDGLRIARYTLCYGLNADETGTGRPGAGLDRHVPPDKAK